MFCCWAARIRASRTGIKMERCSVPVATPKTDPLGLCRRWVVGGAGIGAWHEAGGVVHALSMVPIPFRSKRRCGQGVDNPTSTSGRWKRRLRRACASHVSGPLLSGLLRIGPCFELPARGRTLPRSDRWGRAGWQAIRALQDGLRRQPSQRFVVTLGRAESGCGGADLAGPDEVGTRVA